MLVYLVISLWLAGWLLIRCVFFFDYFSVFSLTKGKCHAVVDIIIIFLSIPGPFIIRKKRIRKASFLRRYSIANILIQILSGCNFHTKNSSTWNIWIGVKSLPQFINSVCLKGTGSQYFQSFLGNKKFCRGPLWSG